jgi:hypothetical protein
MRRSMLSRLLPVLSLATAALIFGAPTLRAADLTYVVGSCGTGKFFTTIQSALNATPAPTTVEVCPGNYPEQLVITKPVTIEALESGGARGLVVVQPPAGGLITNAADDFGSGVAAQVLVLATRDVTLQNLVIDGTANHISSAADLVAGVYYEDSSGIVEHVTTRYQQNSVNGVGILLEGGGADPAVTVEGCSIHDFDYVGILTETKGSRSELTATIKENVVVLPPPPTGLTINKKVFPSGFYFRAGSTVSATDNDINAQADAGITLSGALGVVSGNTITGGIPAAYVQADGAISFDSNKLVGVGGGMAIGIGAPIAATQIQNNRIINRQKGQGIYFDCHSNDGLVNSNTFIDVGIALDDVLAGTSSVDDSFYDVAQQIREGTSC